MLTSAYKTMIPNLPRKEMSKTGGGTMRPIPIHTHPYLRYLSYNLTYLTHSLIVNPYIPIHTYTSI